MTGKKELTKEDFLPLAKAFGLDINDPHIEELHAYVRKILPALKSIEELDLTDMEPWMPLTSPLFPCPPQTGTGERGSS